MIVNEVVKPWAYNLYHYLKNVFDNNSTLYSKFSPYLSLKYFFVIYVTLRNESILQFYSLSISIVYVIMRAGHLEYI